MHVFDVFQGDGGSSDGGNGGGGAGGGGGSDLGSLLSLIGPILGSSSGGGNVSFNIYRIPDWKVVRILY